MKKLLIVVIGLLVLITGCQKADNKNSELTPEGIAEQIVQALIKGDSKQLSQYLEPGVDISQAMVNKYSPEFSGLELKDFTFEKSNKKVFGDDIVFAKHKDQTNQHYELKFSQINGRYYFKDLNLMYDTQ
jgi:hypothetical protein